VFFVYEHITTLGLQSRTLYLYVVQAKNLRLIE
jgi:hypothetical protein